MSFSYDHQLSDELLDLFMSAMNKPMSIKVATGGVTKKNGIYYTEDEVPVYTLYLGNIPQKKNEQQIKEYFESFGEVESVNIIRKNQRNMKATTFLYGFVTFTKPEYAAKALNQRSHVRFAKQLKVKSADTWKQPKKAQEYKNEGNTGGDEIEEGACSEDDRVSIMELNDDCLQHIFSFLRQNEILKLPFVCQRFYDIILHKIKVSKYLDFNGMHQHYTLMEIRRILSSFGEYITRLHLKRANEKCRRYIDFISLYCLNLEEIHFEMFREILYESFERLFTISKHLKSLTLDDCDVTDDVCSLMGRLRELEHLNLSHNHDITGKHLKNLSTLKVLNLSNCENIDNSHFVALCKSTKLQSLNIVGCYQLSDDAFNALIATQNELERLAISNSYRAYRKEIIGKLHGLKHVRIHREGAAYFSTEVLCELSTERQEALESLELYNLHVTNEEVNRNRILQLKNLKKLCIVRDRFLDDNYLAKVAKNCKLIQELNIAGASNAVTEAGVIDLVNNLKNLKYLNLSYCNHFTYSLVYQIHNVLEARPNKMAKPLTLYALNTQITSVDLNQPDYQKYRKLITVSFEADLLSIEDYDDDDDDYHTEDEFDDVFEYFDTDSDEFSDDEYPYENPIFFID